MATSYLAPGIYVEELATGAHTIEAVGTSTVGFVGVAPAANTQQNTLVACSSWSAFAAAFAPSDAGGAPLSSTPLSHAVFGFFDNGGSYCYVVNIGPGGSLADGLQVLEQTDDISIVCAPGFADTDSYDLLLSHAERRKDRFTILDTPEDVATLAALTTVGVASGPSPATPPGGGRRHRGVARADEESTDDTTGGEPESGEQPSGVRPRSSNYGALYFPRILIADPLAQAVAGQPRPRVYVSPTGHVAGIYARSDATRGVHKAPANEVVRGALGLERLLTRDEQGVLNPAGVNAIRFFSNDGIRVYGARTLDSAASEWKYINVRRLFIMLEQSIARGTQWVVFESNGPPLWKAITRDVTAFLRTIWRSGALMGRTPEEAFFVKCDEETNPPESIDAGRVVIMIGVAPVKPAEFVIFRIGQQASGAQIES